VPPRAEPEPWYFGSIRCTPPSRGCRNCYSPSQDESA